MSCSRPRFSRPLPRLHAQRLPARRFLRGRPRSRPKRRPKRRPHALRQRPRGRPGSLPSPGPLAGTRATRPRRAPRCPPSPRRAASLMALQLLVVLRRWGRPRRAVMVPRPGRDRCRTVAPCRLQPTPDRTSRAIRATAELVFPRRGATRRTERHQIELARPPQT